MVIFRFFEMAAAAILDFWNFKFLTVGTVKRLELHPRAKFSQNRSKPGSKRNQWRQLQLTSVRRTGRCHVRNSPSPAMQPFVKLLWPLVIVTVIIIARNWERRRVTKWDHRGDDGYEYDDGQSDDAKHNDDGDVRSRKTEHQRRIFGFFSSCLHNRHRTRSQRLYVLLACVVILFLSQASVLRSFWKTRCSLYSRKEQKRLGQPVSATHLQSQIMCVMRIMWQTGRTPRWLIENPTKLAGS